MVPTLVDAAQLAWNDDFKVVRAEGACTLVLGAADTLLLQRPLHEVLGISKTQARELDAKARARIGACEFLRTTHREPRWLRLTLNQWEGLSAAGVMDLGAILAGAPPLQISRLSSSLSHEIRNPLSSVKMAVQTLQRNARFSERDQRRLVIANREIRTVERMLWLLSEYGRETAPSLEPASLRTVLQEACALIAPELAEHKVSVQIDGGDDASKIRLDAGRLRPVLAQLLLNVAMGQSEGSRVVVQLADSSVILHDPCATFPAEEAGTLFQPFGSMLARGAGLSLAALHRVMHSHGGEVTARAASPGTVYTLSFPG